MREISNERMAQIARKAAEIVRVPGCWTKGHWAKNGEGRSISPRSPEAICFCAEGAVEHLCNNSTEMLKVIELFNCEFTTDTSFSMIGYNDSVAQNAEDVAKVFDMIAEKYEAAS
jgi:hypothetical protein